MHHLSVNDFIRMSRKQYSQSVVGNYVVPDTSKKFQYKVHGVVKWDKNRKNQSYID